MSLEELYAKHNIPFKDKVSKLKNIVILMPDNEYDPSSDLSELKLDKKEVICLYPKVKENPIGFMKLEVAAIKPELIIQVGGFEASPKLPTYKKGEIVSEKMKAAIDKAIGEKFVNLHHHDQFSIRDGLGTNAQLVEKLSKNKKSFCAVTNHGSLAGWVQQQFNCKKENIKPIFGVELYRNDYRGDDPEEKKKNRSASHLLTLARTEEGFYNIIKIHNDAQLNGYYYSPRANSESLKKWGKGIISSTTCYSGDIPKALLAGDKQKAKEWYSFYKDCFDKFYIELPMIEWDCQVEMNKLLIQFGKEVGGEFICTLDSHFIEKEHGETHDILMLIRDGKTVLDVMENKEEAWQFETRNLYYRTEAELRKLWEDGFEMKKRFTGPNGERLERVEMHKYKDELFTKEILDQAIANTRDIALQCEEMKLDSTLKLPKMYSDGDKILREKSWENFAKKGLAAKGVVYKERLDFELKVITDLGYSDYFLTMEKIISETVKEFGEYAVGYGRGSAAGSLAAYCLGITDIDPIEYGLLFERFLDYSRRPVSVCSFKV